MKTEKDKAVSMVPLSFWLWKEGKKQDSGQKREQVQIKVLFQVGIGFMYV